MRYYFLIILLSLVSCYSNPILQNCENGDLLFIEANNDNLSGAISRVTKNDTEISFDHVGMIEKKDNHFYFLHSSSKNGSEKIDLKKMIQKIHSENKRIVLYRLKNNQCINKAIDKAHSMLGKPYNFLYILNENSYYCSDFIERAYRDCHVFELKPMTFINPSTGKADKFWKEFYEKNKIEIPEGKLGCNPNGLSKSNGLIKILIY